MKICVIKSIFVPNLKYMYVNISSIKNNMEYFQDNKIDHELYLCGWVNPKIINRFNSLIKKIGINYKINLWKINYGKYYLFSKINEFIDINNYLLFMYMDHDIFLFKTRIDINLYKCILTNENLKILIISFNQDGECRHKTTVNNNYEIIDGIKFSNRKDNLPGSIALGSFICSKKCIDILIDKFNNNYVSVYGLDDYFTHKFIYEINYYCVIDLDNFIYHPLDNDTKYGDWKCNIVEKLLKEKDLFTNKNYYYSMQESSN